MWLSGRILACAYKALAAHPSEKKKIRTSDSTSNIPHRNC